jgi:transcriptional regulator with XRE-family HTH domain
MGIHPNHRRRARAARLRAEGLSFEAIGRRLGVTKQCAYALARAHAGGGQCPKAPTRCRECLAELNAKAARGWDHLTALCVPCSAGKPFAERLKACRIAAGLLIKELARVAGLKRGAATALEQGRQRCRPYGETLAKPARVLGEL